MPQLGVEVRTATTYVSRRWRGLWPAVDQVQDLVEALKAGEPWAARTAAHALVPRLDTARGTLVTAAPRSTPDHPSLAALVEEVAQLVGGEPRPGLLQRRRPVPSSRLRRREGLQGLPLAAHVASIRLDGRCPRQPVLILDDVVTSGATLGACAQVLRQAGCSAPITLAALARTARPPFAQNPLESGHRPMRGGRETWQAAFAT